MECFITGEKRRNREWKPGHLAERANTLPLDYQIKCHYFLSKAVIDNSYSSSFLKIYSTGY